MTPAWQTSLSLSFPSGASPPVCCARAAVRINQQMMEGYEVQGEQVAPRRLLPPPCRGSGLAQVNLTAPAQLPGAGVTLWEEVQVRRLQ